MRDSCVGRVAVVTGASRGIGVAIARRLAAEGAKVAVVARSLDPEDSSLPGSLRETVAAIERDGGEVVPVVADLADPTANRGRIVDSAAEAFGAPVDVLVNNAAAFVRDPFEAVSEKRFRLSVEVNVWAPWDLMQHCLAGMRERGGGWVLNVSSGTVVPPAGPPYSLGPTGGAAVYGGTKAFLERMSQGAAAELHGDGIAVNVLAPERAVHTPGADFTVDLDPAVYEPADTMAEAALALVTGDRRVQTGRVWHSLSYLVATGRAVRTLDGRALVEGWQPGDIDPARLRGDRRG